MRFGQTISVLFFLTCSLARAGGTLQIVSEPNDWVGNGQVATISFADVDVSAGANSGTLFMNQTSGAGWGISLGSTSRSQFAQPGCYERAQREPFRADGRPGLDFGYDGRGCNMSTGRFRIWEVEINQQAERITKLAVDFVQHCEGQGPALFGRLRYNSTIPLSTPILGPVFASAGQMNLVSEPGDPLGHGGLYSFNLDEQNFRTWNNYFQTDSSSLSAYSYPYSITPNWSLDIGAADQLPLVVASYLDAQTFHNQAAGHPGISVGLESMSCSVSSGSFDVRRFERDPIDGFPQRADITFTQKCGSSTANMSGRLNFYTQFQNGPLMDDVIFLDGVDPTRAWPLYWQCQ